MSLQFIRPRRRRNPALSGAALAVALALFAITLAAGLATIAHF